MIKKKLLFLVMILLLFSLFGIMMYFSYLEKVDECCDGYRKNMLDGQEDGECVYWSFKDELKGIRGCAVEKSE